MFETNSRKRPSRLLLVPIAALWVGVGSFALTYLQKIQSISNPSPVEPSGQFVTSKKLDGNSPIVASDSTTLPPRQELPTLDSVPLPQETAASVALSSDSIVIDATDRRPPILEVQMRDHIVQGVPIGLFTDATLLMQKNGSIQRLPKSHILSQTITQQRFQAVDRNEFAHQLQSEFGRLYSVRHEGPYLVVAHHDRLPVWSQRFRSIFHSFRIYCSTHGLSLREMEFPLVAVVLGTHPEFLRYAHAEGAILPPSCVGYYSQNSNRIVLYELEGTTVQETLDTICHEATHQLAFNSGLHQRLAGTPLWIAEGFATMFEASALSGLQAREGNSLWPESRRQEWRKLSKQPDTIARFVDGLIRSDANFKTDAQSAYCISWAMTAYLSQRRSQQFERYLAQVGALPPFEQYDSAARFRDFQVAFKTDSRMLTKSIVSFLESLD